MPVGADYASSMGGVPRVLLIAPGWRVNYADEHSNQDGKVSFAEGTDAPRQAQAELYWRRGPLSSWMAERGASAAQSTAVEVLGALAHVYENLGPAGGRQMSVALWELDGRVFEFRARVAGPDAFTSLLRSLRRVAQDEWLSALPPAAVRPVDHAATVAAMLRGVTVPPGFEPSAIRGTGLVKDRYQFGALVAGAVACTWFLRWSEGRRDGDAARVSEAIDAMATATDWPILVEMAESGAYPWVIGQFAQAMPAGHWHGRPLEGDVNSGLGCRARGVPLTIHTAV